MDSDTAVDTPPLDTLDSATAVATTEDSAMATAVVTDTTVESKKSKDQHNAGAQLYPELASVSALSYLTAGYYFGNKKNQNLNKYAVPVSFAFPGLINSSIFTLPLPVYWQKQKDLCQFFWYSATLASWDPKLKVPRPSIQ